MDFDQLLQTAEFAIESSILLEHTKALSSNEFQGRAPGTVGEVKTIDYLIEEFKKVGATAGNLVLEPHSFTQNVSLVKVAPTILSSLDISHDTSTLRLESPTQFVASTSRTNSTKFDLKESEMIFVGYGIHSNQWQWDDFAYLPQDLTGKTLVCLVNDPGFATKDPDLFRGTAMTYEGRWTYKYEEAGRRNADAVFIIHNTEEAGYPWSVVTTGRLEPSLKIRPQDESLGGKDKCLIEGWFTEETARSLFATAGLDYDLEKQSASQRGYKAKKLGAFRANLSLETSLTPIDSKNVLALVEGQSKELVVFTAHWDHFGVYSDGSGRIYHGARDNALGVAALIALAKAFMTVPLQQRQRSVLFLVPTAEEMGLLGSQFYCENPCTASMQDTIACINFDILNIFGKTKDVTFYGAGGGPIDAIAHDAARRQNRRVEPDPLASNGMFFRSDHFNFAKKGVPALFINMGFESVDEAKPKDFIRSKQLDWNAACYHKDQDQVIEDPTHPWCWDLAGCIDDVRLVLHVAMRLVVGDLASKKLT